MKYSIQAKMVKPTAKSCSWCKNNSIWDSKLEFCRCGTETMKHRQVLKMIREEDFRYCKNYRFSKNGFKGWKEFRKDNEFRENPGMWEW